LYWSRRVQPARDHRLISRLGPARRWHDRGCALCQPPPSRDLNLFTHQKSIIHLVNYLLTQKSIGISQLSTF
jgi:hypothetical protein